MSVAEVLPPPQPRYPVLAEERLKVVVADDQPKIREILVNHFRDLGTHVIAAKDGLEALRLVAEERPDLVVLDGLLPGMSGFEAARFIRHLDTSYHPRIALLTGVYKSIGYRNSAKLEYGVDDYLVKPVTTNELRQLVSMAVKGTSKR